MAASRYRSLFVSGVLCASCLCAGAVVSNATAAELTVEQARGLFQEARALIAAGDYSNALLKLQQVAMYRRTPQVTYYIGFCREKTGKLLLALGEYRIALADAHAAQAEDVVAEATAAIARVEPRISVLTVTKGPGAQTATIAVDGNTLGDPAVGKPMPLDPGSHVVTAQARGYNPFRRVLTLGEGERAEFEIMLQERPRTSEQATSEPAQSPNGVSLKTDTKADEGSSSKKTLNILAWVSSGVGVAAFASSGYFFYKRSQAISDMDKLCNGDRDRCPAESRSTYDKGRLHTLLGNVAIGVGSVGVATGVVLFVVAGTSKSKPISQPNQPNIAVRIVTPEQGFSGLSVDGRF